MSIVHTHGRIKCSNASSNVQPIAVQESPQAAVMLHEKSLFVLWSYDLTVLYKSIIIIIIYYYESLRWRSSYSINFPILFKLAPYIWR